MTTLIADAHTGVMVCDSSQTDGDRVWLNGKKVWRWKGSLLGFSGDCNEAIEFLTWWKRGCIDKPPKFTGSQCIVLSLDGLRVYNVSTTPEVIKSGREAIGSGGKAAICAYQALGWSDPTRAVSIVCDHDAGSRKPVRTYRL